MSFCTLTDLENIPYRATEGQRSIAFPTGHGLTETLDTLPTCAGCSQLATDGPCRRVGIQIPVGETRAQQLDADQQMKVRWAVDIWRLFWILDYIQNGYPSNLALNAGQFNNCEVRETYEIVSVSGTTLTIKGKNPKRITTSFGSLNPEWPLEPNRVIYASGAEAMPLGAEVRFLYPSCLHAKLRPHITAISLPASNAENDITFEVTLSHHADYALSPVDEKYPPPGGVYSCEIIWPGAACPYVPNLQVIGETQFTLKTITSMAAVSVELTDTAGGSTRVLWPDMFAGALVVLIYRSGGAIESLDAATVAGILTTAQTGAGAWQTHLDLSGYAGATFEKAVITYRPEAVAEADPYRLVYAATCANCQRDRTGSYVHDGADFCARPQSSAFATFKAVCWQPNCNGFCLGNVYAGYQSARMADPIAEVRDGSIWSALWHRSTYYIQQGLEGCSGTRNFSVIMPSRGGPSFESIIGGFADEVLGGYFPIRYPFFDATMGRRKTTLGLDHTHEVIHGAFVAREEQDASDISPIPGALPDALAQDLGTHPDAWVAQMPDWIGKTDCYNYAVGGSSFGCRSSSEDNQESYATALDPSESEDATLAAAVRARFA